LALTKIAIDLEILDALSDAESPKSAAELAVAKNADPILIRM
jgi:hypothetical protein